MNLLKRLQGSKEFIFLILTSFLFFLLRFPSLFEPLWYGDEGIYQVIGNSLNHGKLLYKEIFDNKPPLLYWLYSFFQSDQFTIRLVSLIFGVLSVVVFFFLAKKLFGNRKIYFIVTFIFAVLFGLPILEGNIANAENFMLLPILASSFFIVSQKRFLIAGFLLGIAFLFKIVAVFDFFAFLVFCLIVNFDSLKEESKYSKKIMFWDFQKALSKLFRFFVGFGLPIFIIIFIFLLNGAFIDFLKATFISNISYVSYGNKIGGTPFLLLVKLVLLVLFLLYLFKKRKKLNKGLLFILIWFSFSLFNALFSQRPYTHYLLVLLPSLSLILGLVFYERIYRKIITIFLLTALAAIILTFGTSGIKKSIYYYWNFISYLRGEKSTSSYQAFFDRRTPFDYEIARFIKMNLQKDETIFIWGNNAQLYQLVGVTAPTKYIVRYHITNYKDGALTTKATLEKIKPRFIVIMPNQEGIPFPLINYSKKIDIERAVIYERVF